MIYTAVCTDIFQGKRAKAFEKIDNSNLTDAEKERGKSLVSYSGDLAWMLVALAKMWQGETNLQKAIENNWSLIKHEESIAHFTFKPEDLSLNLFWSANNGAAKWFIEKSLAQYTDELRGLYNPFGFVYFLTIVLQQTYESLLTVAEEADTNYDALHGLADDIVSTVINNSNLEYVSLMSLKNRVARKLDGISQEISFDTMFSNTTTMKTFRNKLAVMINTNSILDSAPSTASDLDSKLNGLIESARKAGIDIIPMQARSPKKTDKFNFPSDIDEAFS